MLHIPGSRGIYIERDLSITVKTDTFHEVKNGKLKFEHCGKMIELDLNWLWFYANHKFPPFIDPNNIYFFRNRVPKNANIENIHAVFRTPIYYKEGFRYCALVPRYAVSNDGVIIDTHTDKIKAPTSAPSRKYIEVSVTYPFRRAANIGVHRLVANAWVGKNQDESHPLINHIDGNPKNNYYLNLEWVTYQENISHSVAHHLTSQVKTCKVLDIETRKEYSFPSITKACEFMGITNGAISGIVDSFTLDFVKKRYEYRIEGDDRPWLMADRNTELIHYESAKYLFIVTYPNSKRLLIYGPRVFKKYFKLWKEGKGISSGIKLAEIFRKKYPDLHLEFIDRRPESRIEVMDVYTGKVTVYESTSAAAKALGENQLEITRQVPSNGRKQWKRYRIRPKQDGPWPDKYEPYRRQFKYEVINKWTGEKRIFDNPNKASEYVGCLPVTIRAYEKTGKLLLGSYFVKKYDVYVDDDYLASVGENPTQS